MNTISLNEKGFIDDKWQYGVLVDNEDVLKMEVKVLDDVATIAYNGKMSLFRGFNGALLLNELLSYVLYEVNNVTVAQTYLDDDYGLSNYCERFMCETKKLENGITCYYIKK